MRKSFSMALFVVFSVLALAVPASAQGLGYIPQTWDGWMYKWQGNQAMMLHADNLGFIRQIQREGYRNLRDDLRWNDRYGAYGIPVGQGFYPMYDRNRKPMSKKKAAIIYGAIGAVGGELVGRYVGPGTRRNQITSTIVGAGFGALVGALTHRNNDRRDDGTIVTPQGQGQQQNVRVGRDRIPVMVGTRPGPAPTPAFNGPSSQSVHPSCIQQGMVTLENQSVGPLRVFVKGQAELFVVLLPKESKCAPTEGEYTGEIVGTVVSSDGLTGKVGSAPAKPQSLPGLVLAWR